MKTTTWSNVGKNVKGNNVNEIILEAGLDYEVIKEPIYTGAGELIPNQFVTREKDAPVFFGTVGSKYEIVQNADAFAFVDNMVEKGLKFEKAGQTANGMIYIIASLENYNIFGDSMKPYIIFQNSHDGSIPLKAALTTLRIVCQNQFNVAFKNAANTVKIRHTATANQRLHEAERVLAESIAYSANIKELAEGLNSIKLNNISAKRIAAELFPFSEDDANIKITRAEEARAKLLSIYRHDDDLANHRNTGWGMFNAYSDYMTHAEPARLTKNWEESRFIKSINTDMNKAIEIIKAVA